MAELNLSNITTTDFTNQVPDFIVEARSLDTTSIGETYWYFDYAPTFFGYYNSIPEIFSAANALATWTVGQGWTTDDSKLKAELDHVRGMGKDTFAQIIWNHLVVKFLVGDSFIQVKRNDDDAIVNAIPISPERVRLVFGESGLLKRYDVWNKKKWLPVKLQGMLHSSNKRIGDQVHGTSQITASKFSIDARNEALADERIIKHRDKALGIVEYKTNNTGKISYANAAIEKGVKNGEMIGLSEDTAKILPYPSRGSEDRQSWVSYLENFNYQNFGVPRSIVTSDGTSEVGGKMGNVNFEPNYTKERNDIEEDLKNQQQIEVSFNKVPSLGGLQQETEQKNTGQVNIQPNDVEASLTRE